MELNAKAQLIPINRTFNLVLYFKKRASSTICYNLQLKLERKEKSHWKQLKIHKPYHNPLRKVAEHYNLQIRNYLIKITKLNLVSDIDIIYWQKGRNKKLLSNIKTVMIFQIKRKINKFPRKISNSLPKKYNNKVASYNIKKACLKILN